MIKKKSFLKFDYEKDLGITANKLQMCNYLSDERMPSPENLAIATLIHRLVLINLHSL